MLQLFFLSGNLDRFRLPSLAQRFEFGFQFAFASPCFFALRLRFPAELIQSLQLFFMSSDLRRFRLGRFAPGFEFRLKLGCAH